MVNNKKYIGQTVSKLKYRMSSHLYFLRKNEHQNEYLQNAWNKHGEDKFKWYSLEKCENINNLNKKEKHWIKKHKSNNRKYGYNIESGGKNQRVAEETKQKLSLAHTGKKLSKETIQKIVDATIVPVHKYDLDGNYIESYESIKEAGEKNNLKTNSISQCCQGKRLKNYDFQWSYEKKNNIGKYKDPRCKPVIQYDLEGNKIKEWKSATSVAKHFNITKNSVTSAAKGINNTSCGYKWKYKNKNDVNRPSPKTKAVKQYDLNDNFINEYESMIKASKETDTSYFGIWACCKGKYETSNNYKWEYAD